MDEANTMFIPLNLLHREATPRFPTPSPLLREPHVKGTTMFTKPISAVPLLLAALFSAPAFAQAPPSFPPQELDRVVSRIALYPDPLLAQVMAAATYADQIPDAARWADEHHYLTGDALAAAISGDQLPWDPSVQALLPFPSILGMMASDPAWTRELGDAFLGQQPEVMDAVQRERRKAYDYGYLRSNRQILVSNGPYIAISPADPGYM